MSRPHRAVLAAIGLLVIPTAARAQICAGFPSFAHGRFQIAAAANAMSGATAYGGRVSYGGSVAFVRVSAGGTSYSGVDGDSFDYGATLGMQYEGARRDRGGCIELSAMYARGPASVRTRSYGAALSWGTARPASAHIAVLPAFTLALNAATAEDGNTSVADVSGTIIVGVGLGFDNRLTVRPIISVPVFTGTTSTAYGLVLSANLGRR